jgi:hypothetical protein
MHGAKAAVVLLVMLLFTPLHANAVAPVIYGQSGLNTGIPFGGFITSISVDCTTATVNIMVMDDQYKPVAGAQTYLQYVDTTAQLMAQGTTDGKGAISDKLPGNISLMNDMFVLIIEKSGFQNKEVDFGIPGCYSAVTPALPAPEPPASTTTGSNQRPGNLSPQPSTSVSPGVAKITNMTKEIGTNQSAIASAPLPESLMNAGPLAVLAVLVVSVLVIFKFSNRRKGRAHRKWKKYGAAINDASERRYE